MMALVTFLPLISFFLCALGGRMMGHSGAYVVSVISMGMTTLLSWYGFVCFLSAGEETHCALSVWLPLSEGNLEWALLWDYLSVSMLTIVTLVSFLVHVYSGSYMSGDPHLPSFMSYLSLFTFFMVVLVQAENLLVLFIGWEGVGLCSYLLMNFWFTSMLANTSAIKAMLVNSVGDLALIMGLVGLWSTFGDITWACGGLSTWESCLSTDTLCLLVLMGVAGKSAQLGLHTWLPDAMEGPTPVSALMHAATMVTAGVFLMVSLAPLFESSHSGLLYVVLLGSVTALFAATVGLAQEDIKKMMAYSTTSQLGYMVASCGMGQFNLGLSHLMNHAYFKALLFLSAGAIIHNNLDQQDMSKLGNAWNSTIPYLCMIMGSLSLMGFPFLTGFYSKDLIMEHSFLSRSWTMVLLVGAASLTAAYSTKILWKTFFSNNHMGKHTTPSKDHSDSHILVPLIILAGGSVFIGYTLQDAMMPASFHLILPSAVKLVPLVVSLMATLIYMLICMKQPLLYHRVSVSSMTSFLQWAWHFNFMINHTIIKGVWSMAHHKTYKLLDSGWMESVLPVGGSSISVALTSKVSSAQSGLMPDYLLYLVILFSLIAGITH